jgi:WD40 repeat protein/tRNA A-37 threonylcarbamoyl transferase component Bud32
VGRFHLRSFLGQGAFGKVYRAYDPQLDREVALKVPRLPPQDNAEAERFLREAKAASRLKHPNIVAVYEAGRAGDALYIVSELVEGVPLSVRLAEDPPKLRAGVRILRELATALDYAHSEGVIHRDLKPANVMLKGGAGRPQVMDFGLARRPGDATTTREGAVVGTPAYMAPEQARGETRRVGPHSDQYALGVMLYEVITGRRPFSGPAHAVLAQVVSAVPPRPRKIAPSLPRDLEAICQKAMEKDPGRRYPDCGALAMDLLRWERGEPTAARPANPVMRLAKWARRQPALAGLTTAVILATTVLIAGGAVFTWRLSVKTKEATDNFQTAEARATELARANAELKTRTQELQAKTTQATAAAELARREGAEKGRQLIRAEAARYADQIGRARQHLDVGDAPAALRQLDSCFWDMRGWEYRYLWAQAERRLESSWGKPRVQAAPLVNNRHMADACALALSPDGRLVACLRARSDRVLLWSLDAGRIVWETPPGQVESVCAAFSPDGRTIAVSFGTHLQPSAQIVLYDVATGREGATLRLTEAHEPIFAVADAAHRKRLSRNPPWASAVAAAREELMNTYLRPLPPPKVMNRLQFQADGRSLWAFGDQYAVRWDVAADEPVLGRRHFGWRQREDGQWYSEPFRTVALSSNGRLAGVTALDSLKDRVTLYNLDTGQEKAVFESVPIGQLALSSDGAFLAASEPLPTRTDGPPAVVRVWRWGTLAPVAECRGHLSGIEAMSFGPDGRLLTVGRDRTLRIWDAASGQELLVLEGPTRDPPLAYFSDAGRRLVAFGDPGTRSTKLGELPMGVAGIWDIGQVTPQRTYHGHRTAPVLAVAFTPDGRQVASAAQGTPIMVWDSATGRDLFSLATNWDARRLAFSPDGRALLEVSQVRNGGSCRLGTWDLKMGQLERPPERWFPRERKTRPIMYESEQGALVLALSKDGSRLVTGGQVPLHSVVLRETQTRQALATFARKLDGEPFPSAHHGEVTAVALRPGGGEVISAGAGSIGGIEHGPPELARWDAATGRELCRVPTDGVVRALAFTPDGKLLAAGGDSGVLSLLDPNTLKLVRELTGPKSAIRAIAVSPDGRQVAAAGKDAVVWLWEVAEGRHQATFHGHTQPINDLAFRPDGRALASASEDGLVKMWDIPISDGGLGKVTR